MLVLPGEVARRAVAAVIATGTSPNMAEFREFEGAAERVAAVMDSIGTTLEEAGRNIDRAFSELHSMALVEGGAMRWSPDTAEDADRAIAEALAL